MESRFPVSIKTLLWLIAGAIITILFFSTYFRVQEYERGVVTYFGKYSWTAEPGIGFKLPFAHSVTYYRTDIQKISPQKAVNTYTVDNQEVDIVFTVQYRIPPEKVFHVYQNAQDYWLRLFEIAEDRLKAEMGKINVQHVAENRGKIRDEIKVVLAKAVEPLGLVVTDFQLNNLEYDKAFRAAVSAAAVSRAGVEQREYDRQQAEKVAQTKIIAAKGIGDAAREQAKGEADGIKLRGEATASAIRDRAKALEANVKLVELTKAERWDGKLPVQMLSGVVPFMNYDAAK